MKIRILFYASKWGDKKIIDNLIGEWTWLWNLREMSELTVQQHDMLRKFSHAEVWVPDENDRFEFNGEFVGDCYSSTMGQVGGKNRSGCGVRTLPAAEILKHPERWSCAEVPMDYSVYFALKFWLDLSVRRNKGYDNLAIGSFLTPVRFHSKDKYICSEYTHTALCSASTHTLYGPDSGYRIWRYVSRYGKHKVPSPLRVAIWMLLSGFDIHPLVRTTR